MFFVIKWRKLAQFGGKRATAASVWSKWINSLEVFGIVSCCCCFEHWSPATCQLEHFNTTFISHWQRRQSSKVYKMRWYIPIECVYTRDGFFKIFNVEWFARRTENNKNGAWIARRENEKSEHFCGVLMAEHSLVFSRFLFQPVPSVLLVSFVIPTASISQIIVLITIEIFHRNLLVNELYHVDSLVCSI